MARKNTRNPLGSIFKKKVVKNGKKIDVWDVRKRFTDTDGKTKDKTRRCYSYAEAQAALANLQTDIEREKVEAEVEAAREHTLFELIEYFKKEYVKAAVYSRNRKVAGYRQDLETIRRHLTEISEFFGDVPLRSINYETCRRFAEHLQTTPTKYGNLPAPSTYHKKLSILNRILNIAVQAEWLKDNPMRRGKSLIVRADEAERNRMLTFDEEERLLKACDADQEITYKRNLDTKEYETKKGKRVPLNWTKTEITAQIKSKREHLKVYILLALDTAMRRGEIYNLKWWQVDFEKRVIYLTEEAAKETKTGTEGILPLTSRLAEALLEVRETSHNTKSQDLVVGKTDFKRAFNSACKLAGIENLQFRDLRSSAITRMMLSGVAGDLVRKVSRHKSDKVFLTNYTNIDISNAQMIGDKLQKFNEKQKAKVKAKVKTENAA